MNYKFSFPSGNDKIDMGRKSLDVENTKAGAVYGGKHNRCVIFPARVPMVASALERRNQNWTARTTTATDLTIKIGESNFYLHKLPMVSRSEYLNRLVFERTTKESDGARRNIQLDNLPGGSKAFELVVKFCYGWKIDLTATNIAPLCCAANFLEMSDNLEEGNLISKTEAFLSFLLLSSWKDTLRVFKSCESVSTWAKELQIVKRCAEAVAWKACTNPKAFSFDLDNSHLLNPQTNTEENSEIEDRDTWWLEGISILCIDHFIEVVQSIKRRGIRSHLVGSCIALWTTKWLSRIACVVDNVTPKQAAQNLHRATAECLIRILPTEENSVSTNFLLHLLKAGFKLNINQELLCVLEKRLVSLLERCCATDLLVKNHGYNQIVYDVDVVRRVLESYFSYAFDNPSAKILAVGRLVDGYLTLVARDHSLTVESFKSLVEALPQKARLCDDNLYRAIDMYLKAHPELTEEGRASLCGVLECHRLSRDAQEHVMKNDRLPLKIMTRFMLFEQVKMTRSLTSSGSNYRRTKTQAIIRVNKDQEKGWTNLQEIKTMREEVETIKLQLKELQMCKIKLQSQLKTCP